MIRRMECCNRPSMMHTEIAPTIKPHNTGVAEFDDGSACSQAVANIAEFATVSQDSNIVTFVQKTFFIVFVLNMIIYFRVAEVAAFSLMRCQW